jgi:hypothetical protein
MPVKKFLEWLAAALVLSLLALMIGLLAWSEWPKLRGHSDRFDLGFTRLIADATVASHVQEGHWHCPPNSPQTSSIM